MLSKIFKSEKSKEDIVQEHYINKIKTITEHYNGVRINETLVGKISVMKKMSDIFESNKDYLMISKSLPRPKIYTTDENGVKKEFFFNNPSEWLIYIHKEYKDVIEKLKKYEDEEKERYEYLKNKMNEDALGKKREFLMEYGLLPKNTN
jgi:hypothetical protein